MIYAILLSCAIISSFATISQACSKKTIIFYGQNVRYPANSSQTSGQQTVGGGCLDLPPYNPGYASLLRQKLTLGPEYNSPQVGMDYGGYVASGASVAFGTGQFVLDNHPLFVGTLAYKRRRDISEKTIAFSVRVYGNESFHGFGNGTSVTVASYYYGLNLVFRFVIDIFRSESCIL
ncbi:uncharacterized protein LOC112348757 [Selaginella moellendorffii]|uniref:uncharacterized protein LOC112348757 n=1 Tax=Selaginella moellendorffii TaxID=88036 RepID=UPI000D1CCB5A|nr:uncharacterized protein LOC112348757 [Selaginella moellendorffii]|eukprot:XP_024537684.1 uncharacterized protein LOC112348757 [Selaginella moellendorffii]